MAALQETTTEEGEGDCCSSDFTVREVWQQAAIIAFVQQFKYETCMARF